MQAESEAVLSPRDMRNHLEAAQETEWYQRLVSDCCRIVAEGSAHILFAKRDLGDRILQDPDFNAEISRPYRGYGDRIIEDLAKEIRTETQSPCSRWDLYNCIRFAKKYSHDQLCDAITQLRSWFNVTHNVLPEHQDDPMPIVLPEDKYRTIVVDPPWPISRIERASVPKQHINLDYPVMSLDQIRELKIWDMAAEDGCHLYLWTTQRYLHEALHIVADWGFNHIFTMVWHKPGGFQPFGLAQYNCEFILFARKGKLDFLDTKDFFTCFHAPRREHSRKPDEFYGVVRRVSPEPRIDLFAREAREGFTPWGNEVNHFMEKE